MNNRLYRKPIAALLAATVVFGALPMLLPTPADAANRDAVAKRVIREGKGYLGTPYEFGSSRSSTRTFDCSDFTRQAFLEGSGIRLPSDSRGQAEYVKDIGDTTRRWTRLKPGDLMFFMSYRGTDASDYNDVDKSEQRVTHVGIYLGNGKVLHTYSEDEGVTIDRIDGTHWEYRFLFGGTAIK